MPLRVSIEAVWPGSTSLACTSGTCSSAFRFSGRATRARIVPGVARWPTFTGISWSTPLIPARTLRDCTWRRFSS